MKKKIFKTISTIGIMLFTVTLIFGCGKKESTENQNDKQQMNQNQNMDKNMSQNTDKNMNQNMDKSTDKSLDKNMNTSTDKSAEHIMIKLPSMQCKICKKNIERAVNKVPGIIDVNVVVDDKVAHINYDKSKTDQSKIENAITMAGYDANDKKADKDAYNNLDDCCKLPSDQKENSKH